MRRKTVTAAGLAAAVVAALGTTSSASAATGGEDKLPGVTVVAKGLMHPQGIEFGPHNMLYVAEANAGKVRRIDISSGARSTVLSGLGTVAGVSVAGNGAVYAVVGVSEEPGGGPFQGKLVKRSAAGNPVVLANLLRYEKAHNPDGQDQSANDALSNPYGVLRLPGRTLVADAGANDVVQVSDTGRMSTFFAPRNITTGVCEGAENNDPQHPGCDPVISDVEMGPDGYIYVSGLGALAPNAARVWKLNPHTGKVVRTITGLSYANGVAVGPDGSVYVSNLAHGFPEGQPPEGFDFSTVGRVVRITPNGTRTYARVTQPGGLAFHAGHLYAASWILSAEVGLAPDKGRIVRVDSSAFRSTPD